MIKLPEIKLPVFDGSTKERPSFRVSSTHRSSDFSRTSPSQHPSSQPTKQFAVQSATESKNSCSFCEKDYHLPYQCEVFRKLTPMQRSDEVKKLKLCINCLASSSHIANNCPGGTSRECHQKDHTMLHQPPNANQIEPSSSSSSSSSQQSSSLVQPNSQTEPLDHRDQSDSTPAPTVPAPSTSHFSLSAMETHRPVPATILLSTALVKVFDSTNRFVWARALLDSGSEFNVVSKQFMGKLELPRTKECVPINGVGLSSTTSRHSTIIRIQSHHGKFENSWKFHVLSQITSQLPNQRVNVSRIKIGHGEPVLQNTAFGWVVSDRVGTEAHRPAVVKVTPTLFKVLVEQLLTWFYKLGLENLVDIGSNGISSAFLREAPPWWNGPTWPSQPPHSWPSLGRPTGINSSSEELQTVALTYQTSPTNEILSLHSSFTKLVKFKSPLKTSCSISEEGVLCLGGRLQNDLRFHADSQFMVTTARELALLLRPSNSTQMVVELRISCFRCQSNVIQQLLGGLQQGHVTLYQSLTLLTRIEPYLDSRYLTQKNTNPNGLELLTTGQFLVHPRLLKAIPEPCLEGTPPDRLDRWQQSHKYVRRTWELPGLQPRTRWRTQLDNVQVDTKVPPLVQLNDDNLPHLEFARGVEIFTEDENHIRIVDVRTAHGEYRSSIGKICELTIKQPTSGKAADSQEGN